MMYDNKRAARWQPSGKGRNLSAASNSVSVQDYDRNAPARQAPIHGRIVGGTWRKTVQRSRHQLEKPPAWAVDLSDLERAERCGAVAIELWEAEQGIPYYATLKTLRRYGQLMNRGCGRQVMLPLGYWLTDASAATPPPDEPRQGVLW